MKRALITAAIFLLVAAPALSIRVVPRAETTANWSCRNQEDAHFVFSFFVTVSQIDPWWFAASVDWDTTAYSGCSLFNDIYSSAGTLRLFSNAAGTIGSASDLLTCPAQGRNTTGALLYGAAGVIFYGPDTSLCAQPCAPILCHGDNDCDMGL